PRGPGHLREPFGLTAAPEDALRAQLYPRLPFRCTSSRTSMSAVKLLRHVGGGRDALRQHRPRERIGLSEVAFDLLSRIAASSVRASSRPVPCRNTSGSFANSATAASTSLLLAASTIRESTRVTSPPRIGFPVGESSGRSSCSRGSEAAAQSVG